MTPLQYVISENIMRRHLNTAQKAEIGMLLYDEIEKQVKEERYKKSSETKTGMKYDKDSLSKKIDKEKKEYSKEDTAAYKVAQKVKVKPHVIEKAKKIKEVAEKDSMIKEEWEKAKKGKLLKDKKRD